MPVLEEVYEYSTNELDIENVFVVVNPAPYNSAVNCTSNIQQEQYNHKTIKKLLDSKTIETFGQNGGSSG